MRHFPYCTLEISKSDLFRVRLSVDTIACRKAINFIMGSWIEPDEGSTSNTMDWASGSSNAVTNHAERLPFFVIFDENFFSLLLATGPPRKAPAGSATVPTWLLPIQHLLSSHLYHQGPLFPVPLLHSSVHLGRLPDLVPLQIPFGRLYSRPASHKASIRPSLNLLEVSSCFLPPRSFCLPVLLPTLPGLGLPSSLVTQH